MQADSPTESPSQISADGTFVPLRLSGTPANTLHNHLRLEDALNALGQNDHPDRWGRLPGWSAMPFWWVRKEQRYVRHELRLMGSRARLRRIPIKLPLGKADRQACTQLYKMVRATMREAFEAGELTAYAIHHVTGQRSPMLAPAVWLKQARPIFFTGRTVIREPGQADQLADVVLEQAACARWLDERRKSAVKKTSEAMLKRAGELIREHAREHDYGITRAEAFAVITAAAQQHERTVSERHFKKVAWREHGAAAGRPAKAQKERFAQHCADLGTQLAVLFGGTSLP